jgi:hypothetical protein
VDLGRFTNGYLGLSVETSNSIVTTPKRQSPPRPERLLLDSVANVKEVPNEVYTSGACGHF